MASIGYLIPEFPGQTHNFFWREREALAELGIRAHLLSTRRPAKGIASPSWAESARAETVYLYPLSLTDVCKAMRAFLKAGIGGWMRCASIVARASGLPPGGKLRLAMLIPFALKLADIARSQRWNHVHVHSCADAANVAMFASVLSGLNYSLTLHNPLHAHGPNQPQKWSHARFALVITRQIHAQIHDELQGHLPARIEIAPMGVDVEKFRRKTPYRPYTGDGILEIFSCGRLNPAKGFIYLLTSVSQLKKQGFAISLKIAGEDDQGGTGYRRVLMEKIIELDLDNVVELLGAVPEEMVMARLENSHVFILASPEEPLGVVIMEAMSMAVPTIAVNGGGVSELVDANVDGILVPPRDPAAIAEAILDLSGNAPTATRLSNASREKIVRSFSHRLSAGKIAMLLNEVETSRRK